MLPACDSLSLFCPRLHTFVRTSRISRKAKGCCFPNDLVKSLWRKDWRKAPEPVCKTSIPGSNPGGASKIFRSIPETSEQLALDRKSTRLNSSHGYISYA